MNLSISMKNFDFKAFLGASGCQIFDILWIANYPGISFNAYTIEDQAKRLNCSL